MASRMRDPVSRVTAEDIDYGLLLIENGDLTVQRAGAAESSGAMAKFVSGGQAPSGGYVPCYHLRRGEFVQAPIQAAGAIIAGQRVYQAANGQVANTGTLAVGRAVEAATAQNDVIGVDLDPGILAEGSTAS